MRIVSDKYRISRDSYIQPNLHFSLNNVHLLVRLNKKNLNCDFGFKTVAAYCTILDELGDAIDAFNLQKPSINDHIRKSTLLH